jgi:3-methyl-2-oxobutanoate hydroxymethyltransferase
MSKHEDAKGRAAVTVTQIAAAKAEKRPVSVITCYDAAFARLIDQTDIDVVLVGDSLGNVVLGHKNTLPVTMDDMVHHTAAVARGLTRPLLVADMPFLSYNVSIEQAVTNAGRLISQGGAHAVKLEGGRAVVPAVKAIVDAGIPVMGHLGLTPQSVHKLGGYKVQGRGDAAKELLVDAKALAAAGVFSVVLEMVPSTVAAQVTAAVQVATIGIGAGPDCDGQVLVLHDILGFDAEFNPKFLKKYADVGRIVRDAVTAYDKDVKSRAFPTAEHGFKD